MVYYSKISVLVKAILGRFSSKKIQSETWTHPPTSIVNSDVFNFLLCKVPKSRMLCLLGLFHFEY